MIELPARRRTVAFVLVLAVAGAVGGCAYKPGLHDNPATAKLSWFDYLNGGDLRRGCTAGSPDRYRMAYNAVYNEQVRSYDVDAATGLMRVRVRGKGEIGILSLGTAGDLFAPWQGQTAEVGLRPRDVTLLHRALDADGAFAGAPEGLSLDSDGFYWIVTACVGGRMHFAAYAWPSESFEAARFDDLLFAWDPTEVVVNPPRKTTTIGLYGEVAPKTAVRFTLRVGPKGLIGVASVD